MDLACKNKFSVPWCETVKDYANRMLSEGKIHSLLLLFVCFLSVCLFVCAWTHLDRSVLWWSGSRADDQPCQHLPVFLQQDLRLPVRLRPRERQQGCSRTPLCLRGETLSRTSLHTEVTLFQMIFVYQMIYWNCIPYASREGLGKELLKLNLTDS